MGVRLSIEGSESIKLQETSITGIEFGADIPHDSNARSTDLGSTVLIIQAQGIFQFVGKGIVCTAVKGVRVFSPADRRNDRE